MAREALGLKEGEKVQISSQKEVIQKLVPIVSDTHFNAIGKFWCTKLAF